MNWNKHSELEGLHAFLSASKYHWVNYDDEKIDAAYRSSLAAALGTRLHAFAAEAISLGVRLRGSPMTLNMYVNDAIGFRMAPEVVLYYSPYAFGTADAISFRKNLLRIHDLKTGKGKVSFTQLEVYSAFFCLEYNHKPYDISYELRIYQNDEVMIHIPDPDRIAHIMSRIVEANKRIMEIELEDKLL